MGNKSTVLKVEIPSLPLLQMLYAKAAEQSSFADQLLATVTILLQKHVT